MKTRPSRRRGTTAVELAVVAPVLFLLLFGLIEFSRMVMLQQALTNAAREGARLSAMASTVNVQDVDDRVRQHLHGAISDPSDGTKIRVEVNPSTLNSVPSTTVITVAVDVDYADASLFVPWFLRGAGIHGEALMKRE